MSTPKDHDADDITLRLASASDDLARNRLVSDLHEELARIARAELMRHRRGNTLNTHALVNEAFLRLFSGNEADFANRKHFFATAAKAMRQVVIDYSRQRVAQRRGSGAVHVEISELTQMESNALALPIDDQAEHLVALDRALEQLSQLDPRLAQVMEMRIFAGMEVEEIATALGVSVATVIRDSRTAKAFLQQAVSAEQAQS